MGRIVLRDANAGMEQTVITSLDNVPVALASWVSTVNKVCKCGFDQSHVHYLKMVGLEYVICSNCPEKGSCCK